MMVYVQPKKCETCGNCIQQHRPCPFCAQNLLRQAKADEELALALERLYASGRLKFLRGSDPA